MNPSKEIETPLMRTPTVTASGPNDEEVHSHPSLGSYVSNAFDRTWSVIKRHPSWIPVVSTATGATTTAIYSFIATASLVSTVAGIIVGVMASLIPSETLARDLKGKTITWISVSHNFFATSFRLALRGAISAVPILGNGVIIAADLYNHKSEEHLFRLDAGVTHPKTN